MNRHVILVTVVVAAVAAPSMGHAQATTDDRVSALESVLTRLQRTTLTGYVQARGTYQDSAAPESNLFVRRARLNVRHAFDQGRFFLSFDGGQNTVTVKDAYLDLMLTKGRGQRQGIVLRAGQFFRPLGFELERGEADREILERPASWDVLFPGNRDQGFDLSVGLSATTIVNAALLNGGGTSTTALSFRDADDHKDWMVRVRQTAFSPRVDVAVSFYRGRQTVAATATAAPIDGNRNRWGAAVNLYGLLGGTVRGEYIGARDLTTNLGPGPTRGTASARTWFVSYVRPIASSYTVGARYDRFDPDTGDAFRLDGDGEQETAGAFVMRQVGDHVRLTGLWERPRVTSYDKAKGAGVHSRRDLWTFQMQYRF